MKETLKEFVERTLEKCGGKIEKIVTFGSYVIGDYGKGSDIDILTITKEDPFKVQRMLSRIVIDVPLSTGKYISVKVLSTEEYGLQEKINSGFYRSIAEEGVIIG